jgi:hypothetical protein
VEGTEFHKHALFAAKECGLFHREIDAKETTRNKIIAFLGYLFSSSTGEERGKKRDVLELWNTVGTLSHNSLLFLS